MSCIPQIMNNFINSNETIKNNNCLKQIITEHTCVVIYKPVTGKIRKVRYIVSGLESCFQ